MPAPPARPFTLFDCGSASRIGTLQIGRGCATVTAEGSATHQAAGNGYGGFVLSRASFRAAGQVEVASGWLSGTGGASGQSETGYFGASVARDFGRWQVGVATFGSFGSTRTSRVVEILGTQSALSASPEVDSVGGRAQLSYTISDGIYYLQPKLDLDLIRVHAGDASEGGPFLAQQLSTTQTTFGAIPAVEAGARIRLSPTSDLRSFVTLGVSVPTNDRWSQSLRFDIAPDAGSFSATLPMSGVSAVVHAGVQFATLGRFDLQADYNGDFSPRVISNAFALKARLQF